MSPASTPLFDLARADLEHILGLAAPDFAELGGAKLFITGGTGFFGKWLLAALACADEKLDLGLEVTVLSREPDKFLRDNPRVGEVSAFRFERGDVTDFSLINPAFDFILHIATDTTDFKDEAAEARRSRAIVEGTQHVLDLARASGARRVLNVSSGAIYGAKVGQLTGAREDDAGTETPITPYARAKWEAEQLCAESGLDFVTARAFAFLGPHLPLDAHFAAGNFMRDARRGGPILVRGDGTALRSYLYPADLTVWLLRVLVRGRSGRAYNVGSDEMVSTAQLARIIAEALTPAPEVTIQSVQAHGPQNIYLPNIARAKGELGLTVAVPLREAIARTFAFLDKRG